MDPTPHTPATPSQMGDFPTVPEHGHKRHRRRRRHKPDVRVAALNITSFLDMSFALLTFLILGASFALAEGALSAKLPKSGQGGEGTPQVGETPQIPVLIVVAPGSGMQDFSITFEGMSAAPAVSNFDELATQLRSLRYDPQNNPGGSLKDDNPIVIQPRGGVVWQGVIDAFNAAQRARFSNVAIAKAQD